MACAVTVTRATAADIPELVSLMREFYAESGYPLDTAWAEASFRQLLGDGSRGAAWIARIGDDPAGHVVLALRHSMEFGGLAGIVDDLFVEPRHRRQGIATALLGALFEECRGLNAAAVEVEAGDTNVAARELYLRFGLVPNDNGRCHLAVRL